MSQHLRRLRTARQWMGRRVWCSSMPQSTRNKPHIYSHPTVNHEGQNMLPHCSLRVETVTHAAHSGRVIADYGALLQMWYLDGWLSSSFLICSLLRDILRFHVQSERLARQTGPQTANQTASGAHVETLHQKIPKWLIAGAWVWRRTDVWVTRHLLDQHIKNEP